MKKFIRFLLVLCFMVVTISMSLTLVTAGNTPVTQAAGTAVTTSVYWGYNDTTLAIGKNEASVKNALNNKFTKAMTSAIRLDGDDYVPWSFLNAISYPGVASVKTVKFVEPISPASTAGWFKNYQKLVTVEGIENLDTRNVTDMSEMFFNCNSLKSFDDDGKKLFDVSGFDTSNVTNMNHMFYQCNALTSLDVSKWNTSNVTDMSYMFYDCSSLTSLAVSGFDTSNVTTMRSMFSGCSSLTSPLAVSGWDTSRVESMRYMFYNCKEGTPSESDVLRKLIRATVPG